MISSKNISNPLSEDVHVPAENRQMHKKSEAASYVLNELQFSVNSNLKTLEQFKNEYYGKPGSKKRDQLEAGYNNFKKNLTNIRNNK